MLERVSATSRNEISSVFRSNVFFMVIKNTYFSFSASMGHIHLLPEEVFQEVMAWLDRISREEDDDEVRMLIANAWFEQKSQLECLMPDVSGEEIDNATGIIMIYLLTCLIKLGREGNECGDFYAILRNSLMWQLQENMLGFIQTFNKMISHPYYLKHNEAVNEWLMEYMMTSKTTFTDREGRLKTHSITNSGKSKGRKKAILFMDKNKEKDEQRTEYWAKMFLDYLAFRKRSNVAIDCSKDNFVLRSIHAFSQYWKNKEMLRLPDAGSAYLNFLIDDCHLVVGTNNKNQPIKDSTISDMLTPLLKVKLDDIDGDLLKLEEFMSSLDNQDNPLC